MPRQETREGAGGRGERGRDVETGRFAGGMSGGNDLTCSKYMSMPVFLLLWSLWPVDVEMRRARDTKTKSLCIFPSFLLLDDDTRGTAEINPLEVGG